MDGIPFLVYSKTEAPTIEPFTLEEDLIYGADQGADTYLLNRISYSMTLGPAGELNLYDSGDVVIHQFAEDGTYLGNFGRSGQGPGDFLGVSSFFALDEKLVTFDGRNRRLSYYSPDGTLESMVTSSDFIRILGLYPFHRDDTTGFIGYIRHSSNQSEPEPLALYTLTISEFDGDGALTGSPIDTTNALPIIRGNRYSFQYWYRWTIPLTMISSNGFVAWSFAEEYRIRFYNPENSSHYGVQIPFTQVPVTTAMKERIFDNYDEGGQREDARRALVFPDFLPAIGGFYWDDLNRLWVQEYYVPELMEPNYTFQVFSSEGVWLFQQTLPNAPLILNDRYCFIRGELEDGSPVVRRFRIIR